MSKPIQTPGSTDNSSLEQFGYKQELRRGMGLWDVVLYGVLFMVIIAPHSIWGLVQQDALGMSTLVYIVGFIAIFFTALSYVRMSNKFPIAGSVYSYVQRGINPHVGFISGWLILLDYCITPALLYVLVANWGTMLVPGSPWYLWVIVFVAFNTFVNIRGISMTRGIDFVIFAVEILAVIAFIALGCNFIMGGGGAGEFNADPLWQPGKVDAHFLAAGISIAALNFLGFDGISTLAEETNEPQKNIGRGILIALGIIIVCFVAQTYIASLVQPDWQSWSPEHAENAWFYGCQMIGGDLFMNIMLIINIVAIGIANIMNAQLAASRLLYSMGRDAVIPRIFGKVHPKYQTPWVGAIFIGAVALVLSLVLTMADLATLVNFGALASFIMLNFAVFWYFFIKEKKRYSFGNIVKYLICPWLGILILGYVFTGFDVMTYALGVTWFIIGFIICAVKSKGFKEVPDAFKNLDV
ncbi:APC family permease [Adlercreutzia muris]|jgi:amino acid transporter|uniref:APC family permease n=1 Tax=Adlercreutzia muris TaxID=1796610 RepID=A0A7C8BPV7_9ACTN|nr:APC family permease [Adlercreutzia muris]KAB1640493.1 APC family permease [Adlercreutzia muris]MCR2029282.1 APC family permease [Adlercreutzia muris]NCA31702.1 APC family permease [Adlercreutzia muris]